MLPRRPRRRAAAIGSSRVPRRRASSTSAPITLLASSSSGCQSTPTAKRLSGSSIASITSSRSARPLTTSPSPSSLDALVVVRAHGARSAPTTPRGERARLERARRGRRTCRACGGGPRGRRGRAGAARASPPQITFSICIPRQIPSSGMSRSSARVPSASSKRSRSSQVPLVCGMRSRAVGARIDVGAAGEHQPVEQVEQLVGALEHGVVGRQQQRQTAGALHRRARRCAGRRCRSPPTPPSAPSRSRCRCR